VNQGFDVQGRRIKAILFGFCCALFIIIARLFYLQIHLAEEFSSRGERNFLRLEIVDSPRGNIIDRKGRLLATNSPVFDVYWEGTGNRRLNKKQKSVQQTLINLLGDDQEKIFNTIAIAERYSRKVKLFKDIPFKILCAISEQCNDSPNVLIVNHFKRLYPHKSLASHILGYLGHDTPERIRGRYGLEKLFQEELEGETGYVLHVINSTGKSLEKRATKNAMAGKDFVLTLDLDLQRIAEKSFEKGNSGVFIVMDPEDGALLALVSSPSFDPNAFVESLSHKDWEELFSGDSPFLNRVIHALYPPASIFKLITFAAGLESGVIDENTEFECKGHMLFCKRNYFCIKRYGHGLMPCKELLAHSCNIPCYEIARNISVDTLAEYAYRFGLGRSTKSVIKDREGLIPTTKWKVAHKGELWWKGETLSASIGQSYLLVTPLQLARMISSICKGYLVRPRLLEKEDVECEPLILSESTLDFLREAMGLAVDIGSARILRNLKDFDIHAKTGTAQTSSLQLARGDDRFLEHGWFAAYFSYKNEKPLVLVALVERAGKSLPALLMARKFLVEYERLRK
jgi:penicillin-binding protein 2